MCPAGRVGSAGSAVSIPGPPDPGTIFLGLEPQTIWFWGEWEESFVGAPLRGHDGGAGAAPKLRGV